MLALDAGDAVGGGRNKTRPSRAARHRGESGPADPAAPERRSPAVHHHLRPVTGLIQVDRLEVSLLIEPETVEHIASEDHEARAAGAEGDRLTLEVVDRPVRRVAAYDEHAGGRIHGVEDFEIRGRPAHAGE